MNDDTTALAWYRRAIVAAGVVTLLIGDAADDRDQGIQVRTVHAHRPSGHDGDMGQSRQGAAHRHIRDGRFQLRRARARRHARAYLHETRHLSVLLRDSSLHEGHAGCEVDATNALVSRWRRPENVRKAYDVLRAMFSRAS